MVGRLHSQQIGDSGPTVVFMHGNGFCGAVWEPVASELRIHGAKCVLLDAPGHGKSQLEGPVGWDQATDRLLVSLDPPIALGVGHSGGASTLILAEHQSPGTFRGLWCYEPILSTTSTPFTEGAKLAERTLKRRVTFESRDEAMQHFSSTPPFSSWDTAALDCYLRDGIAESKGSFVLSCDPEIEAALFASGPSTEAFGAISELGAPIWICRGQNSDPVLFDLAEQAANAAKIGSLSTWEGADHFGPMTDPKRCAKEILSALEGVVGASGQYRN